MSLPSTPNNNGSADRVLLWMRRWWAAYCVVIAVSVFGFALYDAYQMDGDSVAYMDIADLIRRHLWAGIVNGYWHPLYPSMLALGQSIFHTTRFTELRAYYMINFGIFLLEMLAVVLFSDGVIRLRSATAEGHSFLLDRWELRYIGVGVIAAAVGREFPVGRIRPDALLLVLLLVALAALMHNLASGRIRYAALAGFALGLAYLTKSFAFVFALLCVVVMVVAHRLWKRETPIRAALAALTTLLCFALIAGPYIRALSLQKDRLNFGDSGSLNYAWYVGGTQKAHLQNGEPPEAYGTSEVNLKHPNQVLMSAPLIVSYALLPYGTYPDWFDASFWNDHIATHMNFKGQIRAILRNSELAVRYLLNHPEMLILVGVLLLAGARFDGAIKNPFWIAPVALGVAVWVIYGLVNIEERYATIGFLAILIPLFAALAIPRNRPAATLSRVASAAVLVVCLLIVGETARTALDMRREHQGLHSPGQWYDDDIFRAAHALNAMGIKEGDTVACIGGKACLTDEYWARLAGVRIVTEIYQPTPYPYVSLEAIPNRQQAMEVVKQQNVRALIGYFRPGSPTEAMSSTGNWQQLDGTPFYALLFNPGAPH